MTDDGLTEDYRRAGFSNRLGFGEHPALVVVDFCQAYLDEQSPAVCRCGRRQGVVHTGVGRNPTGSNPCAAYQGGVPARRGRRRDLLPQGRRAGVLRSGQPPRRVTATAWSRLMTRWWWSSSTPRDSSARRWPRTLTSLGVDTLIITGVSTSGCVRATALDACQHGFVPIVVRDACGDRDQRVPRGQPVRPRRQVRRCGIRAGGAPLPVGSGVSASSQCPEGHRLSSEGQRRRRRLRRADSRAHHPRDAAAAPHRGVAAFHHLCRDRRDSAVAQLPAGGRTRRANRSSGARC